MTHVALARLRPAVPLLAVLATLAAPAAGQKHVGLDERPAGQAVTGLPVLPPLTPDSPSHSILWADRIEVRPDPADAPIGITTASLLHTHKIGKKVTGTGFAEPIEYLVPSSYDEEEDDGSDPRPLLVAYHGFGSSATSVSAQTLLDEQCEARGWFYLAPTGLDDKLFGSEPCQRHVEVAVRWMLDRYAIDPDRIYMVGFSMGAGVTASFAARHRDPDDLMVAAVALVSGGYDWTMTWTLDPVLRPWLENPYNFGGPPAGSPFAYHRSSGLVFDPATYPPVPGLLRPPASMAVNLARAPTWITWDTGDPVGLGLPQQGELAALLAAHGGATAVVPVSGTIHPATGAPAAHSWAVLDEDAALDFLAPHRAERFPAAFEALLPRDGRVAWVEVERREDDAFAHVAGRVDELSATIELDGIVNVRRLTVRLGDTALAGHWPVRVSASSGDGSGFELRLRGAGDAPGYMVWTVGGDVVRWTESDPDASSLSFDVDAGSSLDAAAHSVPWRSALRLAPDPADPGSTVTVTLDGPAGATIAWLVVAADMRLVPLGPNQAIVASPFPPALILPLPLDLQGDASLSGTLPANPALSGARVALQAVFAAGGPGLLDASNAATLDIR